MMSAVRSKHTIPERKVRSALFAAGFRFRIHARNLPGHPDIVLPRFRVAIFVHGCFWHGHDCPRGRRPVSNVKFWNAKLDGNQRRDRAHQAALERMGWKVVIVWECKIANATKSLLNSLRAKRSAQGQIAKEFTR